MSKAGAAVAVLLSTHCVARLMAMLCPLGCQKWVKLAVCARSTSVVKGPRLQVF